MHEHLQETVPDSWYVIRWTDRIHPQYHGYWGDHSSAGSAVLLVPFRSRAEAAAAAAKLQERQTTEILEWRLVNKED